MAKDTAQTPQAATQTPTTENVEEEDALRVSSVEELIESIRPGARIILELGYDEFYSE